jgi:hypothetical protein
MQELGQYVNGMKDTDIIVALDFDGTCVTHEYPRTGSEIGAAPVLRYMAGHGFRFILYTMRGSEKSPYGAGTVLDDAVRWFTEATGTEPYGVNMNPDQSSWTDSPKVYAQLYIDDAAFGAPLAEAPGFRPFLDWRKVTEWLYRTGRADRETCRRLTDEVSHTLGLYVTPKI